MILNHDDHCDYDDYSDVPDVPDEPVDPCILDYDDHWPLWWSMYMNHVDHCDTNDPGASCAHEHDNPKNHNKTWAYDHG